MMSAALTTEDLEQWWNTEERMTSQEVADYLGIRLETFYKYRCEGRLIVPDYQFGRKKYFKRSDLLRAIADNVEFHGAGL